MSREVESRFAPTEPQLRFLKSKARVKGFGGAMGGGKTRTMCEHALDLAIDHPGIQIVVARQRHTTIVETTRKMMDLVVPAEMIRDRKRSGGEDWIDLYTPVKGLYSRVNFIGFDDPVKWYSSEIGAFIADEAHEMAEDDVQQMLTRIRQRCRDCLRDARTDEDGEVPECTHMPHVALLGFNPSFPGHWLARWFIHGAAQTDYGFVKPELFFKEADTPYGDCEFVIAKAQDNPYLSRRYVTNVLGGLSPLQRRRLRDGEWLLLDGSLFFDAEALSWYSETLSKPWKTGETAGDPVGNSTKEPIRVKLRADGPLAVWRSPVRKTHEQAAHRYIVAVDVSSGGGADYTGIQVIDIEAFEQVAELQVKLDPDLAALEAFRLACIYNGALIVPEITGGWGFTIVRSVEKLLPHYKGPASSKPMLYTRRIEDRLSKQWTDKLGWETSVKTRMVMLDALEEALREKELILHGTRTHSELTSFARDERGRPAAIAGEHDDLVIPLAMGVYLALSQPKQLRKMRHEEPQALFGATGY